MLKPNFYSETWNVDPNGKHTRHQLHSIAAYRTYGSESDGIFCALLALTKIIFPLWHMFCKKCEAWVQTRLVSATRMHHVIAPWVGDLLLF